MRSAAGKAPPRRVLGQILCRWCCLNPGPALPVECHCVFRCFPAAVSEEFWLCWFHSILPAMGPVCESIIFLSRVLHSPSPEARLQCGLDRVMEQPFGPSPIRFRVRLVICRSSGPAVKPVLPCKADPRSRDSVFGAHGPNVEAHKFA